jgi:hypothetical protein
MKRPPILLASICLIIIYALCVWTRVGIRISAQEKHGELPFTMEGAFLFYFSNLIAEGQDVPDIDYQAQHPEGFKPNEKISLTVDHILAFVYRSFFISIPYADFLRIAQPLFVCLSTFIAFWISYRLSKNTMGSLWASLMYGISICSILRSTGIEYSRENFALPLLFLHFGLCMHRTYNIFSVTFAALSVALACMIWDGSQVYLTLWVLYECLKFVFSSSQQADAKQELKAKSEKLSVRNISKHLTLHRPLLTSHLIHLFILIPASLIHPYLQDHHFLYSPGMMGLYALSIISMFKETKRRKYAFIFLLPSMTFLWTCSNYFETYKHMIELAFYKLKFINIKPSDPALLPFDVRMLWTPALHSAPFQNLKSILPLAVLSIPALISHLKSQGQSPVRNSQREGKFFLLFFYLTSFILFLAFVRLEVLLIFFLACLIGSAPIGVNLQKIKQTLFWNSCIILALFIEAENITKDFSRFERPVLYPHLEGVTSWIRESTPKESIILANFGLSPSFLAYSQRGIVLHPKYESKDMREKIREFAETLFESSEDSFYRFCIKNGVKYYVHAMGTFQDRSSYSWAYMANQWRPETSQLPLNQKSTDRTLAARFEFGLTLRKFYWIQDQGKYRIYKVIEPQEFRRAKLLKKEGDRFFKKGLFKNAERKYHLALKLNPNDPHVYFSLAKLFKQTGAPEKAIQATKEGLKKLSDIK